jgi:predicted MFS family arabinose efflux permease
METIAVDRSARAQGTAYIATVVAIGVVGTLVIGVSPLIVSGLVESAHLTITQAGYCASVETGGMCLGIILALLLTHRSSSRRLISGGLVVMVVGNMLSTQAIGFASFAGLRLATGIGSGLTILYSLLLAQTARPQRNFAILMAANVVVSSACSAAVPALLAWHGIAGVYLALTLAPLACLLNVRALTGRSTVKSTNSQQRGPQRHVSMLTRRIWSACALQLVVTCSLALIWTYLSAFGTRSGISGTAIALAVSLSWLGAGSVGSLSAGLLDGKVKATRIVLVCALCFIGIIAMLWFSRLPTLFYLNVALFVFVWSVIFPPLMEILAVLDPRGRLAMIGILLQTVGFSLGAGTGRCDTGSLIPCEYRTDGSPRICCLHRDAAAHWQPAAGHAVAERPRRLNPLSLLEHYRLVFVQKYSVLEH